MIAGGNNSEKPSNEDMDKVEDEDNKTPVPRGSCISKELSEDEEPYITPFLLNKKIRKEVAPPPDDTEAEDSEIEEQLRGKANTKKAGVVKSSSNKVS